MLVRFRVTTPVLWLSLVVVALVDSLILTVTRVQIYVPGLAAFAAWAPAFGLGWYALHRLGFTPFKHKKLLDRATALFEGLFFLQCAWLTLRLLNHLTMMAPFPIADDLLLQWDLVLGLDFMAYFNWVHDTPGLFWVLDISYTSLTPLTVLALFGLVALGQPDRARRFMVTFFVTALVCMVIGTAFPAWGTVHYLVDSPGDYGNFPFVPGVYHIDHLISLRSAETDILLQPEFLPGLVTFPSFHTASGILLVAAFWKTRLALPVITYCTVMIFSTPMFGGHYFIDLLAGAVVAAAVVALYDRSAARKEKRVPAADRLIPVA